MSYNSKYTGKEVEERLDKVDDIPYRMSELDNDVGYVEKDTADKIYAKATSIQEVNKDIESMSEEIDDLQGAIEGIERGGFSWVNVN